MVGSSSHYKPEYMDDGHLSEYSRSEDESYHPPAVSMAIKQAKYLHEKRPHDKKESNSTESSSSGTPKTPSSLPSPPVVPAKVYAPTVTVPAYSADNHHSSPVISGNHHSSPVIVSTQTVPQQTVVQNRRPLSLLESNNEAYSGKAAISVVSSTTPEYAADKKDAAAAFGEFVAHKMRRLGDVLDEDEISKVELQIHMVIDQARKRTNDKNAKEKEVTYAPVYSPPGYSYIPAFRAAPNQTFSPTITGYSSFAPSSSIHNRPENQKSEL